MESEEAHCVKIIMNGEYKLTPNNMSEREELMENEGERESAV